LASYIGIKIANGEFYPILDTGRHKKRRLVLTTVHDGQNSVQIDLYRSAVKSIDKAEYIGTLVVEDIKAGEQGKASIELTVSSNEEGEAFAEARDLDNPDLSNAASMSFPLEPPEVNPSGGEINDVNPENYPLPVKDDNEPPESCRRVPLIIAGGIILLVIAFFAWFFIFNGKKVFTGSRAPEKNTSIPAGGPQAKAPARPENTGWDRPVEIIAPPVPEREPPPEITAPPALAGAVTPAIEAAPPAVGETLAKASAPPPLKTDAPAPVKKQSVPEAGPAVKRVPPVSTYKVPENIPKGGVTYKIRWGDTLWDISQAFYRTPYYYRFLARYNGIKNPNRLISGRIIRIPPR